MRQFFFQIAILLVVIFVGLYLSANPDRFGAFLPGSQINQTAGEVPSRMQIVNSENSETKVVLNIEIADTIDKRKLGLGGRVRFASDSGMLFVFDQVSQPNFWMKGMKIPLDFVWINGDKVVDLLENVAPPENGQSDSTLPRYAPNVGADKVLEVNAGFIKTFNIKIGDKLELLQMSPIPSLGEPNFENYSNQLN